MLGTRSVIFLLEFILHALFHSLFQTSQLTSRLARVFRQIDRPGQLVGHAVESPGLLVLLLQRLIGVALFEGVGGLLRVLRLERIGLRRLRRQVSLLRQVVRLVGQRLLLAGQLRQTARPADVFRTRPIPSRDRAPLGRVRGRVPPSHVAFLARASSSALRSRRILLGQPLQIVGGFVLLLLDLLCFFLHRRVRAWGL